MERGGCSSRKPHALKERFRCKLLNGHELFAEYLILTRASPRAMAWVSLDLGSPGEVRFSQTTTEEVFPMIEDRFQNQWGFFFFFFKNPSQDCN